LCSVNCILYGICVGESDIVHPGRNKQKLEINNVTVVKADKSKSIVIINKDSLQEKINDFITNNQIRRLGRDPTQLFHKLVKESIQECKAVIPQNIKYFFTQMKPMAPELNALIKHIKSTNQYVQ
jgi:hypothetical protein